MVPSETSSIPGAPRALAARAIALYLPQYHPIPENNQWWSPGFTEWTNVARARPLFRDHYQPHIPADLGFYDLRLAETRQEQADMARAHGIEGFCYYHYWFGNGRRLLQRPFEEVLRSKSPDFPFCLAWANQTWAGVWHGLNDEVLIQQTYPGEDDHRAHFEALRPAFEDPRYIRVDGKPLFVVYRPMELPEPRRTLDFWREMAVQAGLPGLYLVGESADPDWHPHDYGYDAYINMRALPKRRGWVSWRDPVRKLHWMYLDWIKRPMVVPYAKASASFVPEEWPNERAIPCVVPNWDNTPRSGSRGLVLQDSTPQLFRSQLGRAIGHVRHRPADHRIVFIKSWNEWAEGNYLEPDLKFGFQYLQALRDELSARAASAT